MNNNSYESLSEATAALNKKGFTVNFRVKENGKLTDNHVEIEPSQVKLIEFHRFEGMTNPADSTILYAVETDSGLKGVVVDSYGADGSEVTSAFMNKVQQDQYKREE